MNDSSTNDTEGKLPSGKHPADVVREFAAAWEDGRQPEVVSYLNLASGLSNVGRVELAADLIRVDFEHRLRFGEERLVEEYLHDIPELRGAGRELVALLIDEHTMRMESGQTVSLDEYARRFPEHLETLRNELGLTDDRTRSPVELTQARAEQNRSPAADSERLEPGQVIGDFRVQRRLGAGGVSQVYLARQLSLDRDVALKVTAECDGDSSAGDEGRTMAALSHPHIVSVFAEERVGCLRLLAMEFVDGSTMADFLQASAAHFHGSDQRRRPSAADAMLLINEVCASEASRKDSQVCECRPGTCRDYLCEIVRDLARALAAAAAQGVLHGDVKPANILLTRDGKAMLADFNVSLRRETTMAEQVIEPQSVGGTLLYMSPEQLGILTGSDCEARIDERSDLYSLGLVLFEALTGSWPFREGQISSDPLIAAGQLQASRLSSPIEFPSGSRWLTPGLKSIIRKCLAPQPENRYQHAQDLAEDLDRFLHHRPLKTATDPDRLERAVKWIKRSPTGAVIAGIPVLFVLLWVAGGLQENENYDPLNDGFAGGTDPDRVISSAEAAKKARDADRFGQQLIREGDFPAAAIQFERATELNPQMATAWHNLGVARFRLGQFADALGAFDRSIALGNESGLAYSHRAASRFALGDHEGAEADFAVASRVASPHEKDEVERNQQEYEMLRDSGSDGEPRRTREQS